MIDAVSVLHVEVVDRDELDKDIVQAPVRDPASVGIEYPSLFAYHGMGSLRNEIAPVHCSAFFHVSTFRFQLSAYQTGAPNTLICIMIVPPGDAADGIFLI